MTPLNFEQEQDKLNQGFSAIVGIDEVGRGPWAGPVTASAVILDPYNIPTGMKDSKKISPKKRELLYTQIIATSLVGIGEASVEEIDKINIRQATFLAMKRAVENLSKLKKPDFAFVDGRDIPYDMQIQSEAVIKGDNIILSISAASIVAKVTRDRLMGELAQKHPHFAWERNAGYGTKDHQNGLASHGVTIHHRRSFAPIRKLLGV